MSRVPGPNEEKTNPWQREVDPSRGPRTLVIVGARGLEERSVVANGTMVIGRDPKADVQIDDRFVSKRHAVLQVGEGIFLVDEGSSNGTYVNGARIAPHQRIQVLPSDVIHVGSAALLFRDAHARQMEASPRNRQRLVVDPSMVQLYDLVRTVAPSRVNVLLLGETGAGKEVLAASIHEESPRASAPFVRINCASLPASLVEAELFGYERGAFTGAQTSKVGLLEAAHNGTLFLDEIGECTLETQAKLLRFLETGELLRVGAVQPKFVDVRVVAATNRDLPQMVSNGTFRADFYFRLNGITLHIPPLRERRSEILPLAEEFAKQSAARMKSWSNASFTAAARERLMVHDWPGNVRELRATVERAVLLSPSTAIDVASLHIERLPPSPIARPITSQRLTERIRPAADTHVQFDEANLDDVDDPTSKDLLGAADPERQAILKALVDTAGNQSRAAEVLGISRRTLLKRLDAYEVPRPRKPRENR